MNTETISLPSWDLTITEIDADVVEIKGRQFRPALRAEFRRHNSVDYGDGTFVIKESPDVFDSRILAYEIAVVNGLEFLCPFYLIGEVNGVMEVCHIIHSDEMMSGFLKSEIINDAFVNTFNDIKFPHSFMFNRNSCKVSPFETDTNSESMQKDYPGFTTRTLISTIYNKKMTNFVVARFDNDANWAIFRYKSGGAGFEEIEDIDTYDMVLNILFVIGILDDAKSSTNFGK